MSRALSRSGPDQEPAIFMEMTVFKTVVFVRSATLPVQSLSGRRPHGWHERTPLTAQLQRTSTATKDGVRCLPKTKGKEHTFERPRWFRASANASRSTQPRPA